MKRGTTTGHPAGPGWHSLRRRTDKIAAYGALGLLVVFLVSAPVLSVFAGHWAYRAFASAQQHERAWREVAAVLLQAAPLEPGNYDVSKSWARVRWIPRPGTRRKAPSRRRPERQPAAASGSGWMALASGPGRRSARGWSGPGRSGGRGHDPHAQDRSGQCRVLRPVVARSMSAGRPTGIRSDRGGPDSSGSAGSRFVGGRFTVMVRPEASRAAALDGR